MKSLKTSQYISDLVVIHLISARCKLMQGAGLSLAYRVADSSTEKERSSQMILFQGTRKDYYIFNHYIDDSSCFHHLSIKQ